MKSQILLGLGILTIVLASGCTGGNIQQLVKQSPDVQEFLKEHPNAEITAVLWTKDYIEANKDKIDETCLSAIERNKDYYKVNIKENESEITVWIRDEGQKIVCIYKKGVIDSGGGNGLNCSDSGIDIKHVYSDCWDMILIPEIENNGSITLHNFKTRVSNAKFSMDFDLQPKEITLKPGNTANLSLSLMDMYLKLNQSGFSSQNGNDGGKFEFFSQTCPENTKINFISINPQKVVNDVRCTTLSEIGLWDYGVTNDEMYKMIIQTNGDVEIRIKNKINESIIIKEMKISPYTTLQTLDPPTKSLGGDVKINPGEEKWVVFPKIWHYPSSDVQHISFAIRFIRESEPNKYIINGGLLIAYVNVGFGTQSVDVSQWHLRSNGDLELTFANLMNGVYIDEISISINGSEYIGTYQSLSMSRQLWLESGQQKSYTFPNAIKGLSVGTNYSMDVIVKFRYKNYDEYGGSPFGPSYSISGKVINGSVETLGADKVNLIIDIIGPDGKYIQSDYYINVISNGKSALSWMVNQKPPNYTSGFLPRVDKGSTNEISIQKYPSGCSNKTTITANYDNTVAIIQLPC